MMSRYSDRRPSIYVSNGAQIEEKEKRRGGEQYKVPPRRGGGKEKEKKKRKEMRGVVQRHSPSCHTLPGGKRKGEGKGRGGGKGSAPV